MIKLLRDLIEQLKNVLLPPSYFAWQTVIYLSLFSWLMSWVAYGFEASRFTLFILTTASWIFLALGVGWALEASHARFFGIPLAPWVAGAILCTFLFGVMPGDQFAIALASWPLISALIIAVPHFFTWDLDWKIPQPPVRQQLILLALISLLMSSWFQFYFRLQGWLEDYPSLLAESFENSGFVYRFPGASVPLSAGVSLLTAAETTIEQDLEGKPWPWVERWLLNLDEQQVGLERAVRDQLTLSPYETPLWEMDVRPISSRDGYELQLQAFWRGPSADPGSYYLEKSCLLMPVNPTLPTAGSDGAVAPLETAPPTRLASFSCELGTLRKTTQA